MSAFETALDFVLAREGGYVVDPHDPGGETNYGISAKAYPDVNVSALTRAGAAAIYRRDFWDKVSCNLLPPGVALVVFDTAVNQGQIPAIRLLQLAARVPTDGRIGPVTLAAVVADPLGVIERITVGRIRRYESLAHYEMFANGWIARAVGAAIAASKM